MQKRILILVTLLFAVISNLTANGLKVIHPNGNEKFLGGKEITLKWENPNSYFPLNLYYSIDNAKNWILIDKNINVNEYKWKTPKIISNKCLFKVEYIQKGKDETIFESGQVSMLRTICFSPDSKYIASGSDDNSIKIWLTSNQTEIKKLSGHSSRIEYLSWSSNGKYLASASSSVVKVWDTSTWTVLYTLLQHSGSVFYVDWNKSSTFIASTGEDRTICIWDISNGSLKKQIITNHSLSNSCVTWSNDEKHIAVGSWDGSFSIWNAQTYQQEQKVTTSGGLRDIDYSYNDDYIATNSADAIVDVYNVSQNQLIYKITKHSSQGETIAWHHQKNIFASSARDGKVYIWDIDNSADLINEYVVTNCPVVDLDWDRSNDCIVASGISTKIHILCDAKDAADVDSSDAVWEIYGCPELNCQNITKDFYNTGKYTLEFEIFNPTENPVEITSIKFVNGDYLNYKLISPTLPKIIKGKEKLKGLIEFNGDKFGKFSTDLVVYTECDSNKAKIENEILCPELECKKNNQKFYNIGKHTLEFELFNPSESSLEITSIKFVNGDYQNYKLISPTLPKIIKGKEKLKGLIEFNGDKFGKFSTDLVVYTECDSNKAKIENEIFCPELIIVGNNETYGDIKTYEIPISLINESNADLEIKTLELLDVDGYYELISPTVIPFTIKAKSTYTMIVKFTPKDFGIYSAKVKYTTYCDSSAFDILNVIKCMLLDPADYVKGFTTSGVHDLKVPIYNPNSYPVIINEIEKTGIDKDYFEILAPSLPVEISGNTTVDLILKLTATEEREYYSTFILKTFCDTSDINVMSFIECPELVLDKEIHDTIRYKKHQIVFDIFNPSRIATSIKEIKIVGDAKKNYSVFKPSTLPYSLLPNTTLNAIINFECKSVGDYPITVQVITDCDTFFVDINITVDCPQLEFSNTKFNFINPDDDNIIIMEIFNPSSLDANISKVTIYGSDKKYYEILEPQVPFVIPSKSSITMKVRFKGTENRKHEVNFSFLTDCDEQIVPIITTINCPKLGISSQEGVFYEIDEYIIDIPITNPSYSDAVIQKITITGKDQASFTLISPSTLPHSIDAESTYNLQVKLDAKEFGLYTVEIEIMSDCDTNKITLTYIVDCPVLDYKNNLSTFDEIAKSEIKVKVRNTSTLLPVTVSDIKFEGQDASAFTLIYPTLPFNIPTESEIELIFSFSPKELKDYETKIKLITQCDEFELSIVKKVIIVTSSNPSFGSTIVCEKQVQRIEFTNNYFEPLIIDLLHSQFIPNDNVFFFDTSCSKVEVAKDDTVSIPIGFKADKQGHYATELNLATNYKDFKFYLSTEVYNIVPLASLDTTVIELSGTEKISFYTSIPANYKGYIDEVEIEIIQSNDGIHLNTNSIVSDAKNLNWTTKYHALTNSNTAATTLFGKGKLELPFEGKLFEIDYESTIDTTKITDVYFKLIYDCIEEPYKFTTVKRNSVCNDDVFNISISGFENNLLNVTPNPVKDYLKLNYSIAFDNSNCKIEIVNLLGEIVYNNEILQTQKGKYNELIDFRNIANGVYFVNFYVGDFKSNIIINVEK